ncbi:2661_t:CDS:1, partial [Entrophospora sp. SA101]
KDYQRGRRGRKMPRVLTQQLINFKKVMCGKIKPTYCAKMIYLRLEGLKIKDALISTILRSCPDIRTLILDRSDGFSNIPIIEIARYCPKLLHLSLNSCICLTDRCITEITRSCPKLKHLELGDCSINNKAVEEIARNCTNLKYLSLEGCNGISEEVMKKLNSKISVSKPSAKIKHPDYSDDEFSDSDLPPLVPDPLRVSRSVIFTGGPNRMVLTNTIIVTDLISEIRVSSALTDSDPDFDGPIIYILK